MSRLYDVTVTISEFDCTRRTDIENAVDEEAGFSEDNWVRQGNCNVLKGILTDPRSTTCHASLTGGETEQRFADRVAKAAFVANGKPFKIEILTTCLEDLPFERFRFGQAEFDSLGVAEALAEEAEDD